MSVQPALERVMKLLEAPPADPDTTAGYLNLLGPAHEPAPSPAQRAMQSTFLPRIYEKIWRPVGFNLAKGWPFGPDTEAENALARERLGLGSAGTGPAATVLDVACGPGNVTRALATGVAADGLVVGIDVSATMLARAVADTYHFDPLPEAHPQPQASHVAYVRGNAVDLPFRTGSFDAVCCFGALYLFDDPWAAVDGMTRVLQPGGTIVILTSLRRLPLTARTVTRLTGIRFFGANEVTGQLSARGYVEVRRRSYGLMQFVSARLR